MEAVFMFNTHILVPTLNLERTSRNREFISSKRKKSVLLSRVGGNGTKYGWFPSVWTEVRPPMKTAAGTELGAANIETENLVLPSSRKNQPDVLEKNTSPSTGIGIVNFLRGKCFFITGATGFLAKVLIEKILRTTPDVGKIYLLIKAKNNEAAMDRLKSEIINVELFKCLKQIHGKAYEDFMLSKLTPVAGNVCQSDLGLEQNLIDVIANEVDVIINSAANTTFHERYDVAIDINTQGPSRLMGLAKTCKKLKVFLHVSTAYVNGQRQGKIMEKPFSMGDSIASETTIPGSSPVELNVEEELKLASNHGKPLEDNAAVQRMKELGLERARTFGWQDTYVFTKAMGEMVIDSLRGDIPVVIIRPSIIESTCNEPFPGWIEGNRMIDPIIQYHGRGQLTGFLGDPNVVIDVVPADMVVNATLAAMAKHGEARKPGINVYQIGSSVVNPLVLKDLFASSYEHFNSLPCMDSKRNPIQVSSIKLFNSWEDFLAHLWQHAHNQSWLASAASLNDKTLHKLKAVRKKELEQVKYLAHIYEPYAFYGGRFDNSNIERLMRSMHQEETSRFGFDVKSIDWKDYIINVHIPGVRRHVMKRRGMHS